MSAKRSTARASRPNAQQGALPWRKQKISSVISKTSSSKPLRLVGHPSKTSPIQMAIWVISNTALTSMAVRARVAETAKRRSRGLCKADVAVFIVGVVKNNRLHEYVMSHKRMLIKRLKTSKICAGQIRVRVRLAAL